MLSIEDIERVLEVAEEYGFSVDVDSIDMIWEEYSNKTGEADLPFDSDKIASIFREGVTEQ